MHCATFQSILCNLNCVLKNPNIIYRNSKTGQQILISFGTNISDKTTHQMLIQVPASPNMCFYTTRQKTERTK